MAARALLAPCGRCRSCGQLHAPLGRALPRVGVRPHLSSLPASSRAAAQHAHPSPTLPASPTTLGSTTSQHHTGYQASHLELQMAASKAPILGLPLLAIEASAVSATTPAPPPLPDEGAERKVRRRSWRTTDDGKWGRHARACWLRPVRRSPVPLTILAPLQVTVSNLNTLGRRWACRAARRGCWGCWACARAAAPSNRPAHLAQHTRALLSVPPPPLPTPPCRTTPRGMHARRHASARCASRQPAAPMHVYTARSERFAGANTKVYNNQCRL